MDQVATYYVTLKPIAEGRPFASGMLNIAYVNDPAVEEIGVFLSAQDMRVVPDEKIKGLILDHLKSCGIEKPEHWKEVSEQDYTEAVSVEMNQPTDTESYNDFSKKDGSGQWLVRYQYQGANDAKTRSFCSEILGLNRLYTEEEIKNGLSNPEFGNYSIWDYKGSYGCRHVWKRKIFFEDYEDGAVRSVGFVPQVIARLDDREATTLNAFLSKDELMQVCAPLLIPEKKIPRRDELGTWNMVWSKDTIMELEAMAVEKGIFKKDSLFKDTHRGDTAPSYVLDHWITQSDTDKAYTDYGFDIQRCPIGTLFVLSQITDAAYWNNEIKRNGKHAYSIEALMNLSIIKMSKMEKEQIILPDGEHLINGTIYVVKDGVVVEKKDVTEQQEEVIEEVAEKAVEEMSEADSVTEEKPVETLEEVVEEAATAAAPIEDNDRIAKLEANQEDLLTQVATLKSEIEKPKEEEVTVAMSDNRPMWKRISDAIVPRNQIVN